MPVAARAVPVAVALAVSLLVACAGTPPRDPLPSGLRADLEGADPEARYFAVLALRDHDSPGTRALLRRLLASEESMTRNAAARVLCDLGERDAAAALVANLHRDERTYVTVNAIHHLHAIFGTDLGYDANLGYTHQTAKQAAWRARLGLPPVADPPPPLPPPDPDLERLRRPFPGSPDEVGPMVVRAWRRLGELNPEENRHPVVVARVEAGFEVLVKARPELADLWNNLALAAVNAGHPERALEAYRKAIELDPDSGGLRNDRGIVLEALNRLDDAAEAYREAIGLDPENDVAWANLGDVLRKQGYPEQARAAYEEADRIAPEKWTDHRIWIREIDGGSRSAGR